MRTRILILITALLVIFTASVQAQIDVTICNNAAYTIANAAPPSNGEVDKYRWFKDNEIVDEGPTNVTYTIPSGTTAGTYKFVRQAHAKACDMWVSSNVFTVQVLAYAAPAKPTISGNSANTCPTATVTLTASGGSSYKWYRNGIAMGVTTATLSVEQSGIYSVANVSPCGETRSNNKEVTITACCHSPGVTATMQNFNPCTDAAVNSTWNLTDTRNNVTYKVRLLADGRFWMVDDLKYPTACGTRTSVSGFTTSQPTGTLGANVAGFYGNCTSATNTSTPAGRGYLYDWMFVMQNPEARYGATWDPGCTNNPGTKAACRGICPEGWHVPTGNGSTGEFTLLNKAVNSGSTTSPSGLLNTSTFSAVYGGYAYSGSLYDQGSDAYYWSSSYVNDYYAYYLYFRSTNVLPSSNDPKNSGRSLRCVRNY